MLGVFSPLTHGYFYREYLKTICLSKARNRPLHWSLQFLIEQKDTKTPWQVGPRRTSGACTALRLWTYEGGAVLGPHPEPVQFSALLPWLPSHPPFFCPPHSVALPVQSYSIVKRFFGDIWLRERNRLPQWASIPSIQFVTLTVFSAYSAGNAHG